MENSLEKGTNIFLEILYGEYPAKIEDIVGIIQDELNTEVSKYLDNELKLEKKPELDEWELLSKWIKSAIINKVAKNI